MVPKKTKPSCLLLLLTTSQGDANRRKYQQSKTSGAGSIRLEGRIQHQWQQWPVQSNLKWFEFEACSTYYVFYSYLITCVDGYKYQYNNVLLCYIASNMTFYYVHYCSDAMIRMELVTISLAFEWVLWWEQRCTCSSPSATTNSPLSEHNFPLNF